jgi:hypothetical protein
MTDATVGAVCEVTVQSGTYEGTYEWYLVASSKYIMVCDVGTPP